MLNHTAGDKLANFSRAAVELLQLAKREPPPTRLAIIDALAAMGVVAGIDTDKARAIMAQASEAPKDGVADDGGEAKPADPRIRLIAFDQIKLAGSAAIWSRD